ncbi:MAG: GtrA family protein [Sedimentisphaerales bacterium]
MKFTQILGRENAIEFRKYFFASAQALAVDYGCYWLLASNGLMSLPSAAVTGYSAGLVVAYFLIADKVFKNGWLNKNKKLEFLLFVASGLLGILLTYVTVWTFIQIIGERINMAKLSAVVASFVGVYIFRKLVVFKSK